jgi:RNA polymerase sigma-70 factor (ECF subfamily)
VQEQGTREARFAEIATVVTEPVRRFLARRTDPDTADDVLADTLLVCWRRLDDVPAGDEALPWAYAVARNSLSNAERGARRQHRLVQRIKVVSPPTEEAAAIDPPDPAVAATLARMRAQDAELMRLWAWEELAPAEIATVLGISANAVAIRLHRARSRFKEIHSTSTDADES